MIVLGIGTGRCGTQALMTFLNLQKVNTLHESVLLPWTFDLVSLNSLLAKLRKASTIDYPDVGEVNFSLLNYIEPLLKEVMKNFIFHHGLSGEEVKAPLSELGGLFPANTAIRVVCLRRDKAETLKSWMNNHKNFNFWSNADHECFAQGLYLKNDILGNSFPKYDLGKEAALACFWDDYYLKAAQLELAYPENFKIFDMSELFSDTSVQEILLDFLGIPVNKRFSSIFNNKIDKKAKDTSLDSVLDFIAELLSDEILKPVFNGFNEDISLRMFVFYNLLKIAMDKTDEEMRLLINSSERLLNYLPEMSLIFKNDTEAINTFLALNKEFISFSNEKSIRYNYFPKVIENLKRLIGSNLLK
ncbi:MAG: hypothetical protein ACKO3R_05890 [bacterium]